MRAAVAVLSVCSMMVVGCASTERAAESDPPEPAVEDTVVATETPEAAADDDRPPDDTIPPFDVESDDLCEWLGADAVAAAASAGYAARGVDGWSGEAIGWDNVEEGYCQWELVAGAGTTTLPNSGGEDLILAEVDVDFEWNGIDIVPFEQWWSDNTPVVDTIGTVGFEHPALPEGVFAVPYGWGWVAFGGPDTDGALLVVAYLHGGDAEFEIAGTVATAAALIEELGWPGSTRDTTAVPDP